MLVPLQMSSVQVQLECLRSFQIVGILAVDVPVEVDSVYEPVKFHALRLQTRKVYNHTIRPALLLPGTHNPDLPNIQR